MPTGRFTRDDILRLWRDSVDPEFARGILDAGDGEGAEVVGQMAEQLAAVSLAAERASQELYLLPGSGQSWPPAGGAAKSTVELSVVRSRRADLLLVLEPGTLVEEVQVDAGPSGGVEVRTGRRYALPERVAFFPGEVGPVTLSAPAERAGSAYDLPAPGTIRGLVQPGASLGNEGASVESSAGPTPHRLRSAPFPDAPVPEHVGQSVELTLGANVGQVRRVVGYEPPVPEQDAGSLLLARDALWRLSGPYSLPNFAPGQVGESPTGATCRVLRSVPGRALVEVLTGTFAPGDVVTGPGGVVFQIAAVEQSEVMTAEAGTASWKMVDPVERFDLAFANALSPAGGRDATLDSLGWARSKLRAPGEDDEAYRERIAEPLGAVSPLAVLRAVNRALVPYGQEAALREAGAPALPGLYLDVDALDLDSYLLVAGAVTGSFLGGELVIQPDTGASGVAVVASPPSSPGSPLLPDALAAIARPVGEFVSGLRIVGVRSDAHVLLPTLDAGGRPEDRFRWLFSYEEMRAFFLVGVENNSVGDFGIAYDEHPFGFYDASPALDFYDGFAVTSAVVARQAWQAADESRAAGVGFDLVLETGEAS